MMHKRLGIKRTAVSMMLAMLLSFAPFAASFAAEYESGPTMEEKLAQLEAELLGLRGLVKSLSVDIQKVADESNFDFGEFQPRLHTVEKISKENAFEVKIMKGSVAELSENVAKLEELRPQIYQANTTMKELKAFFKENAQTFMEQIDGNEAQISSLKTELRDAMVVVGVLEEQISPISVRVDRLSETLNTIGSETDAVRAGLNRVANNNEQATETINAHIGQLENQIGDLDAALQEARKVSDFASKIEVQISELSVRTTESQSTTDELAQFIEQFAQFEGQTNDMKSQVEQIGDQIMELSQRAEGNESQIAEQSSRIDRLQRMRETASGENADSQLQQKLNEAFAQFEATQGAIEELRMSLAASREQIKRDVLSDMPRVPTTDEIVLQIQESAAAQIQEANARADQAQSVALIALLTGLGAIAVSLVL